MKFAFSTAACPTWDLPAVIARATALGFDGVELHSRAGGPGPERADPWAADPDLVRAAFAAAGLGIACLSVPALPVGRKGRDVSAFELLRAEIDVAAHVGCPAVRVLHAAAGKGVSGDALAVALGDWLLPLGDHAAGRGVTLVVENVAGLSRSRQMWGLLDRLAHPAIACAWDVYRAALIGEGPAVSVPTLNAKIQYARVTDALLTPAGPVSCDFGDGDVPAQEFVTRLRGIGYAGYLAVGWDPAWNIDPEVALPEALAKLRKWTKPFVAAGKVHARAK